MTSLFEEAEWERELRTDVLLTVASRLGPNLDVVDVTDSTGLKVRELVLEFERRERPASPAEVRAALKDLIERGWMKAWDGHNRDSLIEPDSEIRLTCQGLVAARRVDRNCGRPARTVVFRIKLGVSMLAAQLDTGSPERDAKLNRSGVALAAALIVLVKTPTDDDRLSIDDELVKCFERLDEHGLRRRSGPRDTSVVRPEAIRRALDELGPVLNLKRGFVEHDRRRDFYYLAGPLPEVRIETEDPRHLQDWNSFQHVVWRILGAMPVEEHILDALLGRGAEHEAAAKPRARRRAPKSDEWLKQVPAPEAEESE